MSDVDREAQHDWLDQRDELRADATPDRSEYEEDSSEPVLTPVSRKSRTSAASTTRRTTRRYERDA